MEVDKSDILGGPILQSGRESQSSWLSASNITFTVLGLLGLYIAGVQVWTRVLIWRERSYKLAMRRRHGIPDNDHRPFNVAYAAVVLARQEQEAAARKAMLQRPPVPQPTETEQAVRQRQGAHREESSAALVSVPGRFDFTPDSGYSTGAIRANGNAPRPFTDRLNLEDRYNSRPATQFNESVYAQSATGRSRRTSHKSLSSVDSRKWAFASDANADLNDVKKTKYEREEDADEDAARPRRGYKRGASQDDGEEDELYESKRGREKRLRKVSLEKSPQYDSEMDIYEEEDDHVPEMKSIVRGKKRDRAEAGSTFGGDEDDSAHEAEVDDQKSRRHRKRRNRRKSEGISSRGKKRDRDVQDGESDLDSDDALLKSARKKRGKKSSPKVEPEDVSMDESPAPSVGSGRVKRRIGEEWESNGVRFKIGPNGQRLRQTLVKKERQKFPMPMDSQHPDRQANLEVCVETWLTEEEYRDAKENHRLAWQDASKSPSEPATPAAIEIPPASPRKGGKDLLWQSTASGLPTPQGSPPSTPAKQNGLRQSVIGGVTPMTPFQSGPVSSKRIASAPRPSFPFQGQSNSIYGSPSLAKSINGKPQLTRWEKEEMEANAIMRLRRKKDEEKKKLEEEEKAAKEKAEKEKKEKEAAAAAAAAIPKIPAITISAATDTKPAATKPAASGFSFPPAPSQPAASTAKPSLFGPSPTPAAPANDTKASGSSVAAPTLNKPAESPFGFGPEPADNKTASSSLNLGAPAAPAASTGSGLKFSFSNPASSSTAPKPEEKEAAPAAPIQTPGSTLFSRLGPQASTGPQPSSAPAPSTTNSFSFDKPAASEPPKQPSSFFASAPSISTPTPAASAPASEPPKFSFGFNKPPATNSGSSSLSGALGNETKPASTASPSFSFKKPEAPASATASASNPFTAPATNGSAASPFSFGGGSAFGGNKTEQKAPEAEKAAPSTPAKSSPFSFAPSANGNATAPAASSVAPKPLFSFGGPASSTASSAPAEAQKSTFGGFGSSTPTPAATSTDAPKTAFGFGSTSTPSSSTTSSTPAAPKFSFSTSTSGTEAPKPLSGFGASASTPASTTTTSNDAPKPTFSFGSTTTNGTSNGDASQSLFSGMGSNTASLTFGSTSSFGATKTGEAKTPAAFGFGTPAASTTNGTAFGTPSASTNGTSTAFNFGDASKSTTQPSNGSIFGSSTSNGTASPFGNFGAAASGSGGFSFGKFPSTSGDSK